MANKIRSLAGMFSLLATYVAILIVSLYTGLIPTVFKETMMLVTGSVQQIPVNNTTFLVMFLVILAVVAIELPITVISGISVQFIYGTKGSHAIRDFLDQMTEGSHFFKFFKGVAAEELVARGLFLGLLPMVPFLSGTVAFYILFLVGNGAWALIHLNNYKDEEDRNIARVLPQFIGGIFFTYIFVKYGMVASIFTHFASNAVLFSSHKIQKVGWVNLLGILYSGVLGIIAYSLMTKPVSDITAWFVEQPTFALEGWEFWDYVKLITVASCISSVVFGLLLYDKSNLKQEQSKTSAIVILLAPAMYVGIVYGLFYLSGFVASNVPYRILFVVILFSFLNQSQSASATSKTFWSSLPLMYISVCVIQALGFWPSIAYLLCLEALGWPSSFLSKYIEVETEPERKVRRMAATEEDDIDSWNDNPVNFKYRRPYS